MTRSVAVLYEAILKNSSTAPLSEVLPSVLRLAHELGDDALAKWARLELEGYFKSNSALSNDIVVPEYREVAGQHSDEFGNVLYLSDPALQFSNEYRLRWGVAELERFSRSDSLLTFRDPQISQIINENLGVNVTRFSFHPASAQRVLSGIRSELIRRLHTVRHKIKGLKADISMEGDPKSGNKIRENVVQMIIGILTALLVAYLVFRFGWV